MLHGSVTPTRFNYFWGVLALTEQDVSALRALDIGCGGGFLAEEFARRGCAVVGVDPSAATIETAQAHAARSGLSIDYRGGAGERLPLANDDVDIAYCCDVLEHVDDLDRVIAETARVLKPHGVYLFDTVNRTRVSKLLAIKMMQEWRWTRIFDTPVREWQKFITPQELTNVFARHGLRLREVVGLGPRNKNPVALARGLAQARRGQLSYADLSRLLDFGQTKSVQMSYMGYAIPTP